MKKFIVFLCLFFMVLTLHAKAVRENYREAEERARVSYAFGMAIGSNFDLSSMGIEFDYPAFTEGLRAMIEDTETQFSEQEAMEIIELALQRAMENRAMQNSLLEREFFANNMLRPGVRVTESGLQYEILAQTEGEKPNPDSIVRVNYVGTFIDGRPFDSSTEEGGTHIPLEFVILGWTEGLLMMSPGSQYRLFIPSELAYGSEGIHGVIPPFSPLIFTVELLEIMNPGSSGE
jgi:FKBP-type peptidyl-prolyl cis-trans isomerase